MEMHFAQYSGYIVSIKDDQIGFGPEPHGQEEFFADEIDIWELAYNVTIKNRICIFLEAERFMNWPISGFFADAEFIKINPFLEAQ